MRHLGTPACLAVLSAATAAQDAAPGPAVPVYLEMRPVAVAEDPAPVQEGRARLQAWLDRDGHRELVRRVPAAVHLYHVAAESDGGPKDRSVRWYPMLVQPRDGRWGFAFSQQGPPGLREAAVALFDAAEYAAAPKGEHARLVELIPVSMQGGHFTGEDLARARPWRDEASGPCIDYRIRPERAAEYAAWTERLIRKHIVIAFDGVVVSVPRIESRLGSVGRIVGNYTGAEVQRIAAGIEAGRLHPLPAAGDDDAQRARTDPLAMLARRALLRGHAEPQERRAAAMALREFGDGPMWIATLLAEALAREQDAGVLGEIAVTLGVLGRHAAPALPRLQELAQHEDAQLAVQARKAVEQIEKATGR